MRLKRLYLHGFKTFAPRTEVQFGEGLTAVVGPNGSGKSNIADSIRWVLGEQSLTHLRAKKTEDLIFAGSSKRAPLGMAEVAITIDNSDHLLPIDFAEVTITRRAFRTGENEYYINKSRVRLRDVLDLASTLGQAYTVVGQGLIDQALSLRPEERRELFEEAAAIRGYFVQREDALKRLGKTEENITRLNDLASEIEPQVKRMERQARQAQEFGKLEAELNSLLRRWYTSRWLSATGDLARAAALEQEAESKVEAQRAHVAMRSQELADARNRVWQRVDQVSAMHEQRAQLGARHAAQAQAQAVLGERITSAVAQRQSLEREIGDSRTALAAITEQKATLQEEITARKSEIELLRTEANEVTSSLEALDRQIADLARVQRRHESSLEALDRQAADLNNRLQDAERRRAAQESAIAEGQAAILALTQKLDKEEALLDEKKAAVSTAQREVAEAESALRSAQAALQAARAARTALEEKRRDLTRHGDNLSSQLAAITGEQQANLYSGVRAIVSGASEGRVDGYLGTVAELLQVPSEYEAAIEAALGARLQEVVMRRWDDAERAIAILKQSGAGRATFLPLDTVRSSSPPSPPRGPGIVGLARDLVDCDPSLSAMADNLLNRLLIVEDLPSARKTLSGISANSPFTLATLGGEVVRPGGSITGGSTAREADNRARGRTILGRERKRRDLQAAHDALLRDLKANDAALSTAAKQVQEHDQAVASSSAALEKARKTHLAAQMASMEQQTSFGRLQQELAWRNGLLEEARGAIDDIALFRASASAQLSEIAERRAPIQAEADKVIAQIDAARSERNTVVGTAGESQTRLAVLQETLRNIYSRFNDVEREANRLDRRVAELNTRLETAAREETDLSNQRTAHAGEVAALASQLAEIESLVAPGEREVRELEAEVTRVEAEQSKLQEALLEADTTYSRAAVERQRCSGVLDSLRIEIAEELGDESILEPQVVALAVGAGSQAQQLPLPKILTAQSGNGAGHDNGHANGASGAGAVPDADLERKVYALKSRISRMGPINPLAQEEYDALVQRHEYLQTQLWDLQGASDRLRRIISELDRTMRDQFAATFAQVNEAFQDFFTRLFGGGTARLELTNPEDVSSSGVEIMAQPPGKRMQPLAALSGGERALTSAAILFALLKVRPVPFCVLDEVDAALDESNVTRFRSSLQELGARTQFVVVTHNRGTIEAADTLYGVSMAGDGTSQLLSLKVAS